MEYNPAENIRMAHKHEATRVPWSVQQLQDPFAVAARVARGILKCCCGTGSDPPMAHGACCCPNLWHHHGDWLLCPGHEPLHQPLQAPLPHRDLSFRAHHCPALHIHSTALSSPCELWFPPSDACMVYVEARSDKACHRTAADGSMFSAVFGRICTHERHSQCLSKCIARCLPSCCNIISR